MDRELVSRFVVRERTTEIKVPKRSSFDCKTLACFELRNKIDAALESKGDYSPDKEEFFQDRSEAEAHFYDLAEKAEGRTRYYESNGLMDVYEFWIEEERGYVDDDGEFVFEELGYGYFGNYIEPLERGFEFYENGYGEKFETLEEAINDSISINNFHDDSSSVDSLELWRLRIQPDVSCQANDFTINVDSYDKSDIAKHIAKTKDSYYYSNLEGKVELDVFIKSLERKKHDERSER